MTILEPTLYANGALRLTRHGAGKGDTVLLYTPTGEQFTVPDGETRDLEQEIDKVLAVVDESAGVFDVLKDWFGGMR